MAIKSVACAALPLLVIASLPTQAITLEQLNTQVQQMNKRISEQNQKFRINGFASFGIVQSDSEDSYHRGITDQPNFRRYTKAGIQMTFNMSSDTSVITQLVSRGENEFDTTAEWLYLKHDFGDGFTGKIGRLRKPNYLLSEFFDVGYALPWTQPPVEVYGVLEESANYEAVDLSYDFEFGDWYGSGQFQYGRAITDTAISNDLIAFNGSISDGELTLRAGYSQAFLTLIEGTTLYNSLYDATTNPAYGGAPVPTGLNDVLALTDLDGETVNGTFKGTFAGLAAMYDNGTILAIAEYNTLTLDGFFADQDGYYVMGGYRIGNLMPYVTFAHQETTDDEKRAVSSFNTSPTGLPAVDTSIINGFNAGAAAALNVDQDRTAIGIRWEYQPGIAIKVQYDMVDTGDTIGEFDSFPTDGKVNFLSFTIDTVF
ncbi:hypothetical protein NBRC116188_18130 [Oceaniserpentilla sp. 4NH20-0058]|uniref:hypothetical protein n=1 Tax=Oceaniserpentilla sp. 4NH20-0058 TaxID=3127660 RepID=UPI00310A3857